MENSSLFLEHLIEDCEAESAESKLQAEVDERARDYESMAVALVGFRLDDNGPVVQFRVMLDDHREQRRLSIPGKHCKAQVGWLQWNGVLQFLDGYATKFDPEAKKITPGSLTEREQLKIRELAYAEFVSKRALYQEYNEGLKNGDCDTGGTEKAEV